MKYTRILQRYGYQLITEVTDNGTYESHTLWPDGAILNYYSDTLENMGWPSVDAFLKAKPGFVKEA